MAFSAHKSEEEIKEYQSEDSVVRKQAKQLADGIRNSKHFIAFTGAGISTSAGISDFRGPQGCWTLKAQGKSPSRGVPTTKALPTMTHMSLVKLHEENILKFLISQNCDGLHRRSGFPSDSLSELHGNSNLEYCPKCKMEFLRDFRVRNAQGVHDHDTGRPCPFCKCSLKDSIINFGENLPEKPLSDGESNSKKSDLCLVLGSSLTVTPAADLPKMTALRGGHLVICNMQKTPLDKLASLRVFAKTDVFMSMVMEELGLEIPRWRLSRRLELIRASKNFAIYTLNRDNMPDTFIKSITAKNSSSSVTLNKEPFNVDTMLLNDSLTLTFEFMGHYNEPNFVLKSSDLPDMEKLWRVIVDLSYDPTHGKWSFTVENKNE